MTVATLAFAAGLVVGTVVGSVVGAGAVDSEGSVDSTKFSPPVGSVEGAGSFLPKQPVNMVVHSTAQAARLRTRVLLKG